MDQATCPECGASYQIGQEHYGRSFQCNCGAVVDVPAPGAAPAPGPAPIPTPTPRAQGHRHHVDRGGSGEGTTAFVLGLLGLILCSILSPFAWASGAGVNNRRRAAGLPSDGMATAGYVMGIIGTIILILGVVIGILVLIGGAASSMG